MADFKHTPDIYELRLTREEALGLAGLCRPASDSMLKAVRREMGNVIVPPECDSGIHALAACCRNSEVMKKLLVEIGC